MDNFSEYSEAIVLGKAAKILSKHMLDHKSTFDGTFNDSYIEGWIPSCLLQFVGMIEHVADIKSPLKFGVSKADFVIVQFMHYNYYGRHTATYG